VIELEEFEQEGAIASLKTGQQVIPVSLDTICQPLASSSVSHRV
jgi:hypothetical protein